MSLSRPPSPAPRHAGRLAAATASAAALALVLSACAGSAGGGGKAAASGDGYEYGAEQAEVDKLIADLDPITISYQPAAASPESLMAPTGTVFKEIVEKRSGGKITVDVVWGQAIAAFPEVHDALSDGRLDVAFTIPSYAPDEFPVVDAIGTAMAGQPASPLLGELVSNAVASEAAWRIPKALEEYTSRGITPLMPFYASGGYYTVCKDLVTTKKEWAGKQMRIASQAQAAQVTGLGGSPVSMPYPETYEALQRGTVDCTLGLLTTSAESGTFEVASNIGYTTDHSFSRTAAAYLAGKSFGDLPLAYQQIIFDSANLALEGSMDAVIDGNAAGVKQAKAAGGQVKAFDDDVQKFIGDHSKELTDQAVTSGLLTADDVAFFQEATGRHQKALEDLGYKDGGPPETMDEWYAEDTDYAPFAKHTYENGEAIKHRPGAEKKD